MARSASDERGRDVREGREARDGREGRDRDKPLYMISVAAELTGMHPQTLRVYEQKGLVTPGRSRGNTRLYSQSDIERLNLISKLTDEGINLAGVVRILDMRERMLAREDELEELRRRVRELEDEVHEFRMQEKITALARRGRQPRAGHAPTAPGRRSRAWREGRGLATPRKSAHSTQEPCAAPLRWGRALFMRRPRPQVLLDTQKIYSGDT